MRNLRTLNLTETYQHQRPEISHSAAGLKKYLGNNGSIRNDGFESFIPNFSIFTFYF